MSKKQKAIPAVYKPIKLDFPDPKSPQEALMHYVLKYQLDGNEFMRRWRWEKKLVEFLPLAELERVPPQIPITMIDGAAAAKNKDGIIGPN